MLWRSLPVYILKQLFFSISVNGGRVVTSTLRGSENILPLFTEIDKNNRPRSIYQYSSMAPGLSGQNCKFFKFLLSSNSQKRLRYKENNTKYRSLTRKPRSHVRILIYRTWPIVDYHNVNSVCSRRHYVNSAR